MVGAKAQVYSAQTVLDTGVANQIRAGRVLTVADFTNMGLSTPVGLFNLGDLTNLGSGGNLTNKGAVTFGKGIMGAATEGAVFVGNSSTSALYADSGGTTYAIRTGSVGCWMRTAKSGLNQTLMAKRASSDASSTRGFILRMESNTNTITFWGDPTNTAWSQAAIGVTPLNDDRWHWVVATYDGNAARIYIDGALDATGTVISGPLFQATSPFNIGSYGADAGTAGSTTETHYGRVDEAFVTPDVLNADQIKMLYCAKVAHGLGVAPTEVRINVRRRRKGGPYVTGDFTSTPLSLYNFTAGVLTDAGTGGAGTLTNNATAVAVAGADGESGGAFQFASASSQYLSGSDASLPLANTVARTFGAWGKAPSSVSSQVLMSYGTDAAHTSLYIQPNGAPAFWDGSNNLVPSLPPVNDGAWHFFVAVQYATGSPSGDGLQAKLYLDGRLVTAGTSTPFTPLVSQGANGFRIGRDGGTGTSYFNGAIDSVFITNYAMAQDEISSLYAKGAVALGSSPINPGDLVEQIDATNVYMVNDILASQHQLDLVVAA